MREKKKQILAYHRVILTRDYTDREQLRDRYGHTHTHTHTHTHAYREKRECTCERVCSTVHLSV